MSSHPAPGTGHSSPARAFTLVELLVTIGIIAILIGIAVPTIGKIRTAAYSTNTAATIQQLDQACQAYYTDFRAYPGPLSNLSLQGATQLPVYPMGGTTAFNTATATQGQPISGTGGRITGSENLVLGLCGGLTVDTNRLAFDPSTVGMGARYFNPLKPGRATAYFGSKELSQGKFGDELAGAYDTMIPEFVDRYPNELPIIYARARVGGSASPAVVASGSITPDDNPIISNAPGGALGQYNLCDILPYTQTNIGIGKTLPIAKGGTTPYGSPHGLQTVNPTATLNKAQSYPFDALAYLTDPATGNLAAGQRKARKADAYVLISAGKDRVYGTEDDITNFGPVMP